MVEETKRLRCVYRVNLRMQMETTNEQLENITKYNLKQQLAELIVSDTEELPIAYAETIDERSDEKEYRLEAILISHTELLRLRTIEKDYNKLIWKI